MDRLAIGDLDLQPGPRVQIDGSFVAIEQRSRDLAWQRNAYARRILEGRLPRILHWTLDRPRVLRWVLRAVPRWRPTMAVVDLLQVGAGWPYMTADAARVVGEAWLAEMRAAGSEVSSDGLIFTYTDPSGLPAEVYGVE